MIGLIIFSLGLLFISDGYAIVDEYSPQEQEGRILEEQDIRISPEAGVPTMPEKESKVPEYALGELIVKLKEGKTLEDIQELNAKYNVTAIEKVFKDIPPAQVTLDELKGKLAKLGIEHQSWYWQLDKDSPEYKDYTAKIEKEKQALQKQIQAQEELVNHLEQRQKRAPEGATSPNLENIYLLEIDKETDIPLMASEYQANSAVEYAQPNYIVKVQMLPNDP